MLSTAAFEVQNGSEDRHYFYESKNLLSLHFPPKVEQSTPNLTVSVSLRSPQGTVLPTLPPRVLQGAAVSGERISQDPPRNVVALGWPPLSEEGFRVVSSDASCWFAISGCRSDCTTRQSVAYRAPPPKNSDKK